MSGQMKLLMGNEAIAAGALCAGVQLVSGYPGTPSTEILETVAKRNPGTAYVEWSVNEKAALEVAAGAAYAGARAMVTMKQVGLNVASDPLMSLNYVGVKGGMVIVVADDPGPISSQTEQDTRRFAQFAKVPVLDPASPEEAFEMVKDAFELSEKHGMPVILRPTTRVCHSCASIEVGDFARPRAIEGFIKDSARWVIFPKLSYRSKLMLEQREITLGEEFSQYRFNRVSGEGRLGVACGGVSAAYVRDALKSIDAPIRLFEVATPFPFPAACARQFLEGLDRVLVVEELDPVIEDALQLLCGRLGIQVQILGKRTGHMPRAGENSLRSVEEAICRFAGCQAAARTPVTLPDLPVRPPVLCAGCPHRGSFYAVKQAMKGQKAVFCGDIGCYTLGNAQPLDMADTCLCMGAGITIAQGMHHMEPDAVHFAFVGDSTFFHTGIPGVINAVYNNGDFVLVVLDNSTTAMTGHQPHPGTGKTAMGEISQKIDIAALLRAIGVTSVRQADPLNLKKAVEAVKAAAAENGVRAVIFQSPCIALVKKRASMRVDRDKCVGCRRCIMELGCPALSMESGKAIIDASLCTGCGLCAQVCPARCIGKENGEDE